MKATSSSPFGRLAAARCLRVNLILSQGKATVDDSPRRRSLDRGNLITTIDLKSILKSKRRIIRSDALRGGEGGNPGIPQKKDLCKRKRKLGFIL